MAESKNGPLMTIVVGVVIALLAGGSAPWWWAKLFPASSAGHVEPPVARNPAGNDAGKPPPSIEHNSPAHALEPLYVRVTPIPESVRPGQKVTIYVTVNDRNHDSVKNAKVLISAGGGSFLANRNASYNPHATLMGPFQAAGMTSLAGQYETWWVCNPCAPGYGLSVHATKGGYITAQANFDIKISH